MLDSRLNKSDCPTPVAETYEGICRQCLAEARELRDTADAVAAALDGLRDRRRSSGGLDAALADANALLNKRMQRSGRLPSLKR